MSGMQLPIGLSIGGSIEFESHSESKIGSKNFIYIADVNELSKTSEKGSFLQSVDGKLHVNGVPILDESKPSTEVSKTFGEQNAPRLTSGVGNYFIGDYCGLDIEASSGNIAVGDGVLQKAGLVGGNVAIGDGAAGESGNVTLSVMIGKNAGNTTSGSNEVYIGSNAGADSKFSEISDGNTVIGVSALDSAQAKSVLCNVFMGSRAGYKLSGSIVESVVIGGGAYAESKSELLASGNVIIGPFAAEKSVNLTTTVAIGRNALRSGQSRDGTVIGSDAATRTVGRLGGDVLIGSYSGAGRAYNDITGEESNLTFIGYYSGQSSSVAQGRNSVGIGAFALSECQTPSDSVGIGVLSLSNCKSVSGVTAVGSYSGVKAEGRDSVLIGRNAGVCSDVDNVVMIGAFQREATSMRTVVSAMRGGKLNSTRLDTTPQLTRSKSVLIGDTGVSGSGNIIIGWGIHVKEEDHVETFAVGVKNLYLSGDMASQCLALAPSEETPWGDGNTGGLSLPETSEMGYPSSSSGLTLFAKNGELYVRHGENVFRLLSESV